MQLAALVEEMARQYSSLKIFVQWEIANILYERDRGYRARVRKIDMDYDRDYITSDHLVEKFILAIGQDAKSSAIFLVCQAWHAPRCIKICADIGLNIVGGKFVDDFSTNDPQKWVRNWLACVLKEGTKQ